jgi:hypothetical protein
MFSKTKCLLVIIDVQLRRGIHRARGLEGNPHKVLAQHAGENAVAEGAVLIEDFIDNVLYIIS